MYLCRLRTWEGRRCGGDLVRNFALRIRAATMSSSMPRQLQCSLFKDCMMPNPQSQMTRSCSLGRLGRRPSSDSSHLAPGLEPTSHPHMIKQRILHVDMKRRVCLVERKPICSIAPTQVRNCQQGHAAAARSVCGGNAVAPGVPSSWELASNDTIKRDGLWYKNAGAFLELEKPFTRRLSPGVAFVTMLELEFRRLILRNLHRLQVVGKFRQPPDCSPSSWGRNP
jgi:hypothetical protein